MAPVAKAASEIGARYGLWFEPERVVAGTAVDVAHPEWVLWRKDEHTTGLLDFGRVEVQDYFLEIVGRLMSIPGFGCYRQDFNMDPLQWWLDNDAPDRVGITEARYVEGLYRFWDRLAEAYPDAIRENCASGGRRIDLEAIQRFHFHQKSDLWFHNVADQSSLFALSQYLPNGILSTPIDRMDVTTFHSVLPSSISLGWIADAPDFDYDRAVRLCARFRELRPLLAKDWYPLTPFSRALTSCLGSQYHSPEDVAGMILLFRRVHCPYPELEVSLAGLDPAAVYRLAWEVSGRTEEASGAALMDGFRLALPPRGSPN
ncbi:MAG: alpha-galactosidase [Anaerolineae bacterium]|nr:alpha-galactosidase [Anaerolineae bacterium]